MDYNIICPIENKVIRKSFAVHAISVIFQRWKSPVSIWFISLHGIKQAQHEMRLE